MRLFRQHFPHQFGCSKTLVKKSSSFSQANRGHMFCHGHFIAVKRLGQNEKKRREPIRKGHTFGLVGNARRDESCIFGPSEHFAVFFTISIDTKPSTATALIPIECLRISSCKAANNLKDHANDSHAKRARA